MFAEQHCRAVTYLHHFHKRIQLFREIVNGLRGSAFRFDVSHGDFFHCPASSEKYSPEEIRAPESNTLQASKQHIAIYSK